MTLKEARERSERGIARELTPIQQEMGEWFRGSTPALQEELVAATKAASAATRYGFPEYFVLSDGSRWMAYSDRRGTATFIHGGRQQTS